MEDKTLEMKEYVKMQLKKIAYEVSRMPFIDRKELTLTIHYDNKPESLTNKFTIEELMYMDTRCKHISEQVEKITGICIENFRKNNKEKDVLKVPPHFRLSIGKTNAIEHVLVLFEPRFEDDGYIKVLDESITLDVEVNPEKTSYSSQVLQYLSRKIHDKITILRKYHKSSENVTVRFNIKNKIHVKKFALEEKLFFMILIEIEKMAKEKDMNFCINPVIAEFAFDFCASLKANTRKQYYVFADHIKFFLEKELDRKIESNMILHQSSIND